jgi:hypothetical protein
MIKSLRLGNFKAFAETQSIPIRPLTLIFGANSSGKSSIIHGLLFAQNALETGELDTHRMKIGGESVDLGGFRQYIHHHESERRMHWGVEMEVAGLNGRLEEVLSPSKTVAINVQLGLTEKGTAPRFDVDEVTGHLVELRGPHLLSYELSVDDIPILSMTRRPDNTLQMDRLNVDHPVVRRIIEAVVESHTLALSFTDSDFNQLRSAADALVPTMKSLGDKLVAESIIRSESHEESKGEVIFPVSRGRRGEDLVAALELYLPRTLDEVVSHLYTAIAGRMMDVRYLGPLRSYPPRHIAFSQYHDPNWIAGGGEAWDIVRQNWRVLGLVNEWLGSSERLQTPYELTVRRLVDHDTFDFLGRLEDTIEKYGVSTNPDQNDESSDDSSRQVDPGALAQRIQDLLRDPDAAPGVDDLVLMDNRSGTQVSHRDVGIGISQVLPVLVSAFANQSRIVAIEQPEIHLHPALQAELGDVFIESALGERKNTFILETHSEHLILRVMRRIRETASGTLPQGLPPIKPKDVSILFVEPDGSRSIVREMPVNENGELVKAWPGGFFEEGLKEMIPPDAR